MIRTEAEYRAAVQQAKEQSTRLKTEQTARFASGLSAAEVDRLIQPLLVFHDQLQEEITSYERLKRGDFDELRNFQGIGLLLTALRIFKGISQRELAERLGVHESQVSRDERNEYHGITVERANRILDVIGVELHTHVEIPNGFVSPIKPFIPASLATR
jgi:DNA-binding Xre family transcriptional regulator